MKTFRTVFAQIMLVVALVVGLAFAWSLPELHKEGEASIQYDEAGEEIELTEKDHFAYAQLNHPIGWFASMPVLWLEPKTWASDVAFRHAYTVVMLIVAIIVGATNAVSLWVTFRKLKKSHADADVEELAMLRMRMPFNGWSIFYLIVFVAVAHTGGLYGRGMVLALLILTISEIVRSRIYWRRAQVRKHWKLVHEVKTPKGSDEVKTLKKTSTKPSSDSPKKGNPSAGPVYPVKVKQRAVR